MTAVWKPTATLPADATLFAIRAEQASDVRAREALLDASFGEGRHARTCQRLRDGRLPAEGLAFSAVRDGRLVGTVRLWHVSAGGVPALVLGPLAVDTSCRELGIGAALMRHAIAAAKARGHQAIILRGDSAYYARFGFSADRTGGLDLPGPFERERLLAVELRNGALDDARGMIVATGAKAPEARDHRRVKHQRPRRRGLRDGFRPMIVLDPEAGAWCVDERSRKVTRPALTTLMMVLLGVMIAIDMWKRRRDTEKREPHPTSLL